MADVFISYSHNNIDFARRLAAELRKAKKDVWIDLEGIRLTTDWWEEIRRGIESSDNFLLIMSPASLGSPVCHLEIETARNLKKRVILINHEVVERAIAAKGMQERLSGENSEYVNTLIGDRDPSEIFDANWYILEKYQHMRFAHDADDSENEIFLEQFTHLQEALNTDIGHVRLHTRFALLLRDWESSQQNKSFLLFGDELAEAETWLAEYQADTAKRREKGDSPKMPEPTEAQISFVQQSRHEEDARQARLQALEDARLGSELAAKKAEAASLRSEAASKTARLVLGLVALLALAIIAGTFFYTNQQITAANNSLGTATREIGIAVARQEEALELVATATRDFATAEAAQSTAIQREENALRQVGEANMTLTPIMLQILEAQATITQAALVEGVYITSMSIMLRDDNALNTNQCQRLIPDAPASFLMRGLAEDTAGNYEAAISAYDNAIAANANDSAAYINRGCANYDLGNFEAAIADFTEAIALNSEDALAYNNRGLTVYILGLYEAAIADIEQSIELDSRYGNGLSYYILGQSQYSLGQYAAAVEHFGRVIAVDVGFAYAYFSRGNAYLYLEQYGAAVVDYTSAITLDQSFIQAYYSRGYAYLYLEQYEAAIADYTQVIELDANFAGAYYSRAWAYYILGDSRACRSDFNRAEALGIDLSEAEENMCG